MLLCPLSETDSIEDGEEVEAEDLAAASSR
jgi:hypothetical protein